VVTNIRSQNIILPPQAEPPLFEKVKTALRLNRPLGELNALEPAELLALLEKIVDGLAPAEIEHLAGELSLESLQAAVRLRYPEHVSALETAKQMLEEAKYALAAAAGPAGPTLTTRLAGVVESLLAVLESLLSGLGIADFFRPAENRVEADFKGQKLMLVLSLFTTLSAILVPILGPLLGAKIIGGSLLSICSLSLIYPHMKPQAANLPRGRNWTAEWRRGDLPQVDGRKETLDEMARALGGAPEGKMHVMLIGKSGVGKTEAAKAFVQAIERGDYPQLKGKQVVYFNMADLLSGTEMFSNTNKILTQISEAMGRHRSRYILIFDEIHMACQKSQDPLSEQLKTLLDPGKDRFPHVIGITTEEEYFRDIYVDNPAFARRFKRIAIENTDDAETYKILKNYLLRNGKKVLLDNGALRRIIEAAKEAFGASSPQPAASLRLLAKCVKKIDGSMRTPFQERTDRFRARLEIYRAQFAGTLPYGREKPGSDLEAKLKQLEIASEAERKRLESLLSSREQLAQLKEQILRGAVQGASLPEGPLSPRSQRLLNAFSLRGHFAAPRLEAKIRQKAKALEVPAAIDAALIDEAIQEELDNERRVQKAMGRGKQDMAGRLAHLPH